MTYSVEDFYDTEPEPRDREAEAAMWEDEAERRWEQARDDAVPEPAEVERRLLGYALGRLDQAMGVTS